MRVSAYYKINDFAVTYVPEKQPLDCHCAARQSHDAIAKDFVFVKRGCVAHYAMIIPGLTIFLLRGSPSVVTLYNAAHHISPESHASAFGNRLFMRL